MQSWHAYLEALLAYSTCCCNACDSKLIIWTDHTESLQHYARCVDRARPACFLVNTRVIEQQEPPCKKMLLCTGSMTDVSHSNAYAAPTKNSMYNIGAKASLHLQAGCDSLDNDATSQ